MTPAQPCRGIDVHAHVLPARFPAYLPEPALPGWPSMADAHACHRHVMIDGKIYRTVSDRCWDPALRLADLQAMGLDLQVLSPMPELFSYWLPAPAANELLRYINDQIAEMVAASDGHLAGLGAVPLQDMDRALAELHRVMTELGFAGVEIGSNINGRPIGHPDFAPFFAQAAALNAAVFVHAVRPEMGRVIGPGPLQQALGYPSEIGLAAASCITGQLMTRHPALRIAFSHGGGTLGLLLPRLEQACHVFPAIRDAVPTSPAAARRMFYDSLVFDTATLRHLTGQFGDTQIMLGTDYPFNFHDRTPVARVEEAFGDQAVRDRLTRGNASRFLGRA